MIQKLILLIGVVIFLTFSKIMAGNISMLMNLKAAALVITGAVMGAFLAFPFATMKQVARDVLDMFRKESDPAVACENLIRQMEHLARIRRIYGPRDLDEAAESLEDPFLRKGIELVADEYDRIDIQAVMEKEFEFHYNALGTRVNILATLAKLATAFGFVGTIIGLINVLNHLGSPEQIGQGMALALLTTFYGLLFSNFLFLPLSKKLNEHGKMELNRLGLILEGVMDISSKKNPKAISHRLYSYVETFHRETGARGRKSGARFRSAVSLKGLFNKMTARKA